MRHRTAPARHSRLPRQPLHRAVLAAGLLAATLNLAAAATLAAQREHPAVAACTPALMKDVLTYMTTDQQRYSYFSQIDSNTFEQFKLDIAAKAAVPIPLPGEMIGIIQGSANFNQFKEERTNYFRKVGYQHDLARELRDIRVITNPVAYGAWTECIRRFTNDQKTLTAWKASEDSTSVFVVIENKLPLNVKLTSLLRGGTAPGAPAGKAFRDGTVITGGGALVLLLERDGRKPMKLIMNSNPQIEGLFIESEWGSEPAGMLTGDLILSYPDVKHEDRGAKYGDPWVSADLHEDDCDVAPCSLDNAWQMQVHTLRVTADGNYFLHNPRIECLDTPGEGCAWSILNYGPECAVHAGNKTAECRVWAGARPHTHRIVVTQYEMVPYNKPAAPARVLMFKSGQFTLVIPDAAQDAIFNFKTAAGPDALKPGDASSKDGRIVLVGAPVKAGGGITYTYRLQ